MKNRFLVISKEKLYAYIVSVFTIVTLFMMTSILNSDLIDTKETSTNVLYNNTISNSINEINSVK